MANNKIVLSDGSVLLDLSADTVTDASHIKYGLVAHLNDGSVVTGTLVEEQTHTVSQSLSGATSSATAQKVISGGSFFTEITPTSGRAITEVVVTVGGVDVTSQVFKPGTAGKAIAANGVYRSSADNLSGYDRVVVDVPTSSGTVTVTDEANAAGTTCVITTSVGGAS